MKNCFDRTPHTMKDWLLLAAGVGLAQWRWQLGQAETDDCLANVLGGLLGSGIFALRCRASARLLRRGEDASGHT